LSIKVWDDYLALPGTYRVHAAKPGYKQLDASIKVEYDSDAVFAYTLRKLPALFDITTQPVDGAEVWINNTLSGTTPLKNIELEEGRQEIRITAQGFLPQIRQIESPGLGIRQTIEVTLKPGETGITKPIAPPEGSVALTLTSQPAGARILLNGEFQGNTPATLNVLPGTEHQLALSMNGFATASKSVNITKGETQNISVALEPEYGVVFITCQPADAALAVDGKAMGLATRRLRLTTRPHRLRISKSGYEVYTATITPVAGVSKNLTVKLEKTP
jgi:hypothetical protein